MRLVKRSVNQDDVSAYHLFYSDAKGSPGSDLTFFDWPMPRESRGTRAITRSHLGRWRRGIALPPFLEPRRKEIEANLTPVD